MSKTSWATTKASGVDCIGCGQSGRCTVSPDGTAFKCWRDDGKVFQTKPFPRLAEAKPEKKKADKKSFATLDAALSHLGFAGRLAGTWHYSDAAGEPVMAVA